MAAKSPDIFRSEGGRQRYMAAYDRLVAEQPAIVDRALSDFLLCRPA